MRLLSSLFLVCLASASEWRDGRTTRYWDCCKPSCAWPGKFEAASALRVCDARGRALEDGANARNVCGGGGGSGLAYACPDQAPFYDEATDTSFAFAAASLSGQDEARWCCACYELLFREPEGRLVVQVTNTGGDLGSNHFDLQIPGGGFGVFDGCSRAASNGPAQFPEVSAEAWGQRYGGLGVRAGLGACERLPSVLRAGCGWFFERFRARDNPDMRFRRVPCPAPLLNRSACVRRDESGRLAAEL